MTKNSLIQLEEAIKFHSINKIDIAEKIYEKIIKSDGENFNALYLLGTIKAQRQNYNEAIKLIEKSLLINNKNYSALNNLGNFLLELKKYPEAIEKYKQALNINKNYTAAIYNLGNAYKASLEYKISLKYTTQFLFLKELKMNFAKT